MLDTHYGNPKLVRLYDLDSGWSADRDFYLFLASQKNMSILDFGCGTGLLCNAYAESSHQVTGVDPSQAMLNIGKKNSSKKSTQWIKSPAQKFLTDEKYDLIIMTGHAFQVLHFDADVLAAFKSMKECLKPEGMIVFESRNPDFDWSQNWDYEIILETPSGNVLEKRKFIDIKDNFMNFELTYDFPDESLLSHSILRFWSKDEIEAHLKNSGLQAETVLGDWKGNEFDWSHSEEMIFIVGHK